MACLIRIVNAIFKICSDLRLGVNEIKFHHGRVEFFILPAYNKQKNDTLSTGDLNKKGSDVNIGSKFIVVSMCN